MIALLLASVLALLLSLFLAPLFARLLVKRNYGQFIREYGPESHHTKRGTPNMGGVVIIGSVVVAYLATHSITMIFGASTGPSPSGLLLLMVTVGMGGGVP
ncbi:phospho-N-acetylmuramoyl-pentapeptide-transferase [Renibacterium salmoninarum ATCC 33209]|uniref:Phospho-N-acetylmuramoyl-pentapeptide-transferase n=1 Tax=Renibacterium salmoninarum (strain ATCC 33209 / DSM 20767 / JCM 11484 / NBRC 15589 / NCIMB 2235) TaxID=288705 RepID=A9WM07_RENSM|nr:phospho-N-acetylmuramoyl-pentapeptide-transferase [Renibacterium salmoninarum ATCC 33209]